MKKVHKVFLYFFEFVGIVHFHTLSKCSLTYYIKVLNDGAK